LSGLLPIAQDQAQDAELMGIGQRKGQNVNARLEEQAAGSGEAAGFILQEHRELFEFHAGSPMG